MLRQIPFGTIVPDEDVALPEEMERDVVNRLKDLLRPFVKQRKKDAIYRYQESTFWLSSCRSRSRSSTDMTLLRV